MRALIFDLDGTLVDTVYAHVFAWQRAFADVEAVWDAYSGSYVLRGPYVDGLEAKARITDA